MREVSPWPCVPTRCACIPNKKHILQTIFISDFIYLVVNSRASSQETRLHVQVLFLFDVRALRTDDWSPCTCVHAPRSTRSGSLARKRAGDGLRITASRTSRRQLAPVLTSGLCSPSFSKRLWGKCEKRERVRPNSERHNEFGGVTCGEGSTERLRFEV